MSRLIVLEGPDGVGKTTIATILAERLSGVYCAFPGRETGTLGEKVYDIHHDRSLRACPESVQLLHIAAHIDALHGRIIPWLENGHIVVLDRCYWSTWVYGLTYGVNSSFLRNIIQLELPYWGEWNESGALIYLNNVLPFNDNSDDDKARRNWGRIKDYYDVTISANIWGDFDQRINLENNNLEDTVATIINSLR